MPTRDAIRVFLGKFAPKIDICDIWIPLPILVDVFEKRDISMIGDVQKVYEPIGQSRVQKGLKSIASNEWELCTGLRYWDYTSSKRLWINTEFAYRYTNETGVERNINRLLWICVTNHADRPSDIRKTTNRMYPNHDKWEMYLGKVGSALQEGSDEISRVVKDVIETSSARRKRAKEQEMKEHDDAKRIKLLTEELEYCKENMKVLHTRVNKEKKRADEIEIRVLELKLKLEERQNDSVVAAQETK